MKLAIMQPYFFPYLGYFALIKHSERFILFDTPQFIRHGWIDRNRVLKPDGDTLYIKVPLKKHSRDTSINNVIINNSENWKNKITAQLVPYKKKAPYYKDVIALIENIFKLETNSIVELNKKSLLEVCNYLGINTPIAVWSEMKLTIDEVKAPDEWALNICKALGAKTYYNPPGGMAFFDTDKYKKAGVEIKFLELILKPYQQFSNNPVPGLSIIDVLMFNSKEDVKKMLNQYTLA